MGEVAADAAMGMEQHVIVVDAVVACEELVTHRTHVPVGDNIGVGMAHMVDILATRTDEIAERIAVPVHGWRCVIAFEVIVFRITVGGIVEVVVLTDEAFHILAAIVAVAKMFRTKDRGGEFAQNGVLKVAEGLVHDSLKLCLVVERQTADAQLWQEVVFTHFAPSVVAVIVEGAVETSIVHVGRQLVFISLLRKAIEGTERHDAHVAAKADHLYAVVFVFLDDVVADLVLLVNTFHGGIDLFQGHDMRTDAFVVVQIHVFSETWNPFLFGDNEHVVTPDFATALVVGA